MLAGVLYGRQVQSIDVLVSIKVIGF